ncbi:hypothetical protein RAS12_16250 [Achromobacter seleniivolatilans]|uniref:Glycosyltransferase RgtA/B/C/D-like domain-containing protein n=1 Tax=Achromobacter seleniivolatilans TaxID=3047478 RepID=A0ABY9LTY9_9BURK|nr:hypothetical protein [Achromobacter sp. R39]WMD18203.1 hypothetical protein RAS12_16250 [Achromobacter sp. R39]
MLSLNLGRERPVYQLDIAPAAGYTGSLRVVLYGDGYDKLRKSGALSVPASGWQVIPAADSVTLVASTDAAPIVIKTADKPLQLGLIRYAQPNAAVLSNGAGYTDRIDLQAPTESIVPIIVGGAESTVPSIGMGARFGLATHIFIFILLFAVLAAIALRLTGTQARSTHPIRPPSRQESIWLALPLLLATAITHLSFYPGNVSYDASMQWVQAALRGDLSEPLGYATTYLMRFFALIDSSPALLLAAQEILAAMGVVLVLRELRVRGVPLWGAAFVVMTLALTPQYPTFFSNLGKDALSSVAILFFTWVLLWAFRKPRGERLPALLLIVLVGSGFAAGIIRSNAMPSIIVTLLAALIVLQRRHGGRAIAIAALSFLILVFTVPKGLSNLARMEIGQHQVRTTDDLPKQKRTPRFLALGLFANVYIYHLFSASVASGVPLDPEDTAFFYKVAPRENWAKYDCLMTDTTQTSVTQGVLLNTKDYWAFLLDHQLDMAKAVTNILWKHPSILLDRQICITKMLWDTGVGHRPFQATTVLGYDNPALHFVELAGQNRSLLPTLPGLIQKYKQWTEEPSWFWLFWKPALPMILGLFIVGMYVARTRDTGMLLAALVPLTSFALLLVVIPFPAYRYVYPATLMLMLFSTLAFARPRTDAASQPQFARVATA